MELTKKPPVYSVNAYNKGIFLKARSVEEAIRFFASRGIVFTARSGYREPMIPMHAPTIPKRQ